MKNRRKEKERINTQTEENTEADLEKFIEAFEKPTKIYRFLRTRHAVSPIFLQRSLTYMKHRRSVLNAKRKTFRVDSLLEKKATVCKEEPNFVPSQCNYPYMSCGSCTSTLHNDLSKLLAAFPHNHHQNNGQWLSQTAHHLKLDFLAYYDSHIPAGVHDVEVEAVITKVHHRQKDDGGNNLKKISIGKVIVPVNPSENHSSLDGTQSDTGITSCGELVSKDSFDFTQRDTIKSCTLHLFVYVKPGLTNGLCNGDSKEIDEPSPKRRKSAVNGRSVAVEDNAITYKTDLTIFGKQDQCMLTSGEYDVMMQDVDAVSPTKKNKTWETVNRPKMAESVEMFEMSSTLKFKLTWTEDKEGNHPSKIQPNDFVVNNQYTSLNLDTDTESSALKLKEESQSTPQKKTQVVYQFLYNDNTRQQTDTRDNMRCPWCRLNCEYLYSLLKHLRVFHSRFNIIYVHQPKAAHIHVSINDSYDGAYAGNPQDLNSHIGFAFHRMGPVRRTSVTHVIVYRPKRPSPSLLEFCEPEKENQVCRQIIQGHNRLYYRTSTCLPLKPQEINQDSEDETTPKWLQQKSVNLIDEFTDVNEGEKELMKMWNLHCMKYAYISDCQMVQACQSFVEEHGKEIHKKKIVKNFLVHLVNMFDFSLISPDIVQRTMWQLYLIKDEMEMNGELLPSD